MFAVVIGHNFTFCINTHPKCLRAASLNTTNPQVLVGNIKIGTAVNLDNSRKLLLHSSVHSNFLSFVLSEIVELQSLRILPQIVHINQQDPIKSLL